MKYIIQLLFLLTLFTNTEGFGLRSSQWGGLGLGSLGIYGFIQLLCIIFTIYATFDFVSHNSFGRTKYGSCLKNYMSLYIVILIESFILAIFRIGAFSDLSNIFLLRHILIVFTVPFVIKKCGITDFYRLLFVSSVCAAIIGLYVILFNVQNTAITININEQSVTHAFRVLLPTAALITLGYFYNFSNLISNLSIKSVVPCLLCFAATLVQLHRSSTVSLIICTILFVYLQFNLSFKNILYFVLALIGLFFVANGLFGKIGYSFDMLIESAIYSRDAISAGDDVNATMRYMLLLHGIWYSISNYLGFGIGLHWAEYNDAAYGANNFLARPVYDSGWFSLIIVFGVIGLYLFVKLLYVYFRNILNIRKDTSMPIETKHRLVGLMCCLTYMLLISIGGDCFVVYAPFSTIFWVIISLLFVEFNRLNNEVHN